MKPFKTYLVQAIRVFLGAYFLESGLNYFLRFYPQPTGSGIDAEFVDVITRMHMFTGVKMLDIVAGGCILLNRFTPLMLVVLFPTTVQIVIYDLYTPNLLGLWTGGRNLFFHCFLFFVYFQYYAPLFDARPQGNAWSDVGRIWRNRLNWKGGHVAT